MNLIYALAIILIAVGVAFLLRLNPEQITNDTIKLLSPKNTMQRRVKAAKGKYRNPNAANFLIRTRDELETIGKGSMFVLVCSSSVILFFVGGVIAVALDNLFLIPSFAIGFATLPFIISRSAVRTHNNHVEAELETVLSVISNSYLRHENIQAAVAENLEYIKYPVNETFRAFLGDASIADPKYALKRMREKIHNEVFQEWCDALVQCQDDKTLKDTLLPIVDKLSDIRTVNNELETIVQNAKIEYYAMVGLVIANVPLLYFMQRDLFEVLVHTTMGKIILGVDGLAIVITGFLLMRFTRPIKYRL